MPAPETQIFDQDQSQSTATRVPTGERERDPATGQFIKDGLTPHLVARAKRLGISADEMKEMSAADLREEVREREWSGRLEKLQNFNDTTRAAAAAPGHQAREERQAFEHGLTPDNANPDVIEAFNKMRDYYEARLEELEKGVGGVKQFAEGQIKREAETFGRRIERCFAKHSDIFGEGTIDKMDRDSVEFHLRLAAVAAHKKAGNLIEELDDNIETFVKEKIGRKQSRNEPTQEQRDETAEWEAGVLGHPTQSGPRAENPGREKAIGNVKTKLEGIRRSTATSAKGSSGAYLDHSNGMGRGAGSQP